MRVVHLSCVAPPETGGIGRVAFLETQSLIERRIESALIAPAAAGIASAAPVRRLPVSVRYGNAAFLRRGPLIRALDGADIVHLHYPLYGTAGLVARLRREGKIKKLVMTLHMDATADGMKGLAFEAHRRLLQRRVLQRADVLIVSSKDYAANSSYVSFVDRVVELPFGVDEHVFVPGERRRAPFGIPDGARAVTFVGGMDSAHAFKGVDVFLHALAELPDVHALLAGEGDLRASYQSLVKELGIAERAHFVGKLPPEQLPDAYRAGDVFVFPSTSSAEAFGLVALEAQACGIPVVASQLPGVRTVVENGVTGTLVPPKDAKALAQALRDLLSNDSLRMKMGMAARARVLTKFTWARHMDGLIDIYTKLCASPS